MSKFKIKGISWRVNNTFYVDVEPSVAMKKALLNCDFYNDFGVHYLNVAHSLDDNVFNLSTWQSKVAWVDIPYECSESEKKAIVNFISEWKDKIPENVDGELYGDDYDYVDALSDDIPWKEQILR